MPTAANPDRVTVRGDPDLWERMRRSAVRNHRSVSGEISWFLNSGLEGFPPELPPEMRRLLRARAQREGRTTTDLVLAILRRAADRTVREGEDGESSPERVRHSA